ncbi:MAG: extracellular solute-binding protein [Treponema sp.]|jgi:raffinose/stachyose/melibiose transport system substrate-binding protein|nr:extracellular solute-binding protein [Treponema sp.]
MKKSRIMVAVLSAALIPFTLFAGGKKEAAAGSQTTKKEIVFWNIGMENPDRGIMEGAVNTFNGESSDYAITNVPIQNDSYKQKLVIAMSSKECPDMYTSWTGGPMIEYIKSGYAQPLDSLYNSSELPGRLMKAAIAQATYQGKLYAIPVLNVAIAGIFYNKEMFAKYNLTVPKTLSELEKDCDVLVKNGIVPFALANRSKWTGSMYFVSLATRKGGLEPFAKAVAGTGSFTDDCFIYAGQKIQEWVKKGYFPEGVNSLSEDDGQSRQLMYQGKAAMLLCGSWYVGNFKNDSEEFYKKIGWFSFPAIDGSSVDSSIQIGTLGDQFISFSCTGDKLKAAFQCVTHYSDPDMVKKMVAAGKIPPVQGVDSMITDPVVKSILAAANNASAVQLWYDQYLPPAVAQTHLDTCQELFGLTMTPQQAAEKFQASMVQYNSQK